MDNTNYRMNLQLFADGADEQNEPGTNGGADESGTPAPSGGAPLSFDDMLKGGYQAEFDRRVNKALETAKAKFADPRVAQLQAQLDGYARRDAVTAAGVDARFAKFVASEVVETMKEGDKFDEALKTYLESNPHFMSGGNASGSWGRQQHGQGGGDALSGVEARFYEMNPGLKKKG